MNFSRRFYFFQWIVLASIYLVIIAGSFVRISGSGMGCPDWPKCFNQWIPPTDSSELAKDYKEVYLKKRIDKIDKFSSRLERYGMHETAKSIREDKNLKKEEDFNARKTWTEYVNRLLGFLSGNLVLLGFIWAFFYYRKSIVLYLSFLNLILMGIQGWFGSIVVASNLVPWTITLHLFVALIIVLIQIVILYQSSPKKKVYSLPKWSKGTMWLIFLITFYQMFLGTEVREIIDDLIRRGVGQNEWIDEAGTPFLIHRSFSWMVLILIAILGWYNYKYWKIVLIQLIFAILVFELFSGILLAYVNMPGFVRTLHLLLSSILFGCIWYLLLGTKRKKETISN